MAGSAELFALLAQIPVNLVVAILRAVTRGDFAEAERAAKRAALAFAAKKAVRAPLKRTR